MYAKVFASLWDGTLGGNWAAWSVFVYLLANCDRHGIVDVTPEAISRRSGIPIDQVLAGLEFLEQPDPRSRATEFRGCRIVRLDDRRDWGWRIVNYERYRSIRDAEMRLLADRNRQRAKRERERMSRSVTPERDGSVTERDGHGLSAQAEAEAEAYAEAVKAEAEDCAADAAPAAPAQRPRSGCSQKTRARLARDFPDVDVELVAGKLEAAKPDLAPSSLDKLLFGWVTTAHSRGFDLKARNVKAEVDALVAADGAAL